jgi:hypothetical protein
MPVMPWFGPECERFTNSKTPKQQQGCTLGTHQKSHISHRQIKLKNKTKKSNLTDKILDLFYGGD